MKLKLKKPGELNVIDKERASIHLIVLMIGFILGDYFALYLRTLNIYSGIKYPIGIILLSLVLYLFLKQFRLKLDFEGTIGTLILGAYLGTIFHHNTLIEFPSNHKLLLIWISLLPYLLIFILSIFDIDIKKYFKSMIFFIIALIVSYGYIRSWEVDSMNYPEFIIYGIILIIIINIAVMLLIYKVDNINKLKTIFRGNMDHDLWYSGIYFGIIGGIWLNSFRWEKWGIENNSITLIIFLSIICFTGLLAGMLNLLDLKVKDKSIKINK